MRHHTCFALALVALLASACSSNSGPPEPVTLRLADGTQGIFAPEDALGLGENMITITLTRADATPITGLNLQVDAFMPAHGHGLRQPPVASELGEGRYMVHIDFHMTGRWDMSVALGEGEDAPSFSVPLEVR
ncbi:MAG: FixH family protein [Deltaproteobacteria bacterium]|nr:FixH family protein [Deltaproteobacteria bacterium]